MVEISLSGSGEGPGGAISRGYSTSANFGGARTGTREREVARVLGLAVPTGAHGDDREEMRNIGGENELLDGRVRARRRSEHVEAPASRGSVMRARAATRAGPLAGREGVAAEMSPISSRKMVPWCACSKRPMRRRCAPV